MEPSSSQSLRSLVGCDDCTRQYDVSELRIGDRFHCHCGSTVVVPKLRGVEDAAAIKCPACGAPREPGEETCRFCDTEFTLHEQDLNTICPSCAVRVSDRAKFCHRCGVAIEPTAAAGPATEKACPACDRKLQHRQLGETAVLECPGCAGLWLSSSSFERLLEVARRRAPAEGDASPELPRRASAHRGARHSTEVRYRKCPDCAELMHRRNFGRRSGVILDVCNECGVWFDLEELDRVLDWVRKGGEGVVRRDAARAERRKQINYHQRKIDEMSGRPRTESSSGGFLGDLLSELASGAGLFWD